MSQLYAQASYEVLGRRWRYLEDIKIVSHRLCGVKLYLSSGTFLYQFYLFCIIYNLPRLNSSALKE